MHFMLSVLYCQTCCLRWYKKGQISHKLIFGCMQTCLHVFTVGFGGFEVRVYLINCSRTKSQRDKPFNFWHTLSKADYAKWKHVHIIQKENFNFAPHQSIISFHRRPSYNSPWWGFWLTYSLHHTRHISHSTYFKVQWILITLTGRKLLCWLMVYIWIDPRLN